MLDLQLLLVDAVSFLSERSTCVLYSGLLLSTPGWNPFKWLYKLDVLPLVLYSLPQSRHLAYFLSSDLLKYFQTCEIFDFFLLLCRFGSKSYSESVLGEHSQSGLSALDEDTRRLP